MTNDDTPQTEQPTLNNEIELISDGDGLAVIGDPAAVEMFLVSEGMSGRDLGLERLRPSIGTAAATVQAGSEISAHAGRWVKLTKDSAAQIDKFGLMKGSSSGVSRGIVKANGG